jgi:hypothetical protein
VRRGLVSCNKSPTGGGVMLEGGLGCVVGDVDAVQQGNGGFAAVPADNAGSGGTSFCAATGANNGEDYWDRRFQREPAVYYVFYCVLPYHLARMASALLRKR